MNILIVGCGKVGSRIASALCRIGHDVSIIDTDQSAFHNLDDDFSGLTITGLGIDQDILKSAGIEGCDITLALSENDNQNIMVCQIAKEIFQVPKVLARVYDPRREAVFSHFGINTICPTNLTVESIHRVLENRSEDPELIFDSTTVAFRTEPLHRNYPKIKIKEFQVHPNEKVFGILHSNGRLDFTDNSDSVTLKKSDRLVLVRKID